MVSVIRGFVAVLFLAIGSAGAQTLAQVVSSVQERKLAIVQRAQVEADLRGLGDPEQELIEWTGLPVTTEFPTETEVDALNLGDRIALLNQALVEFEKLAPSYLNLRSDDLSVGSRIGALRPFIQEDFPPLPRVDAENYPVVLAAFARQVRHLKVLPWVASLRQRERNNYVSKQETLVNGVLTVHPNSDSIDWQPVTIDIGEIDQNSPSWLTVSASDPYSQAIESIGASGSYTIKTYHDGPPNGMGNYDLRKVNCSQSTTFFSDARMPLTAFSPSETVSGKVALVTRTESNFLKANSYVTGSSDPLPSEWNPEDSAFHVIAVSDLGGSDKELSANGPGIKAKLVWSELAVDDNNPDVSFRDGNVDSFRVEGSFGHHSSALRRTFYPLLVASFSQGLDISTETIPTEIIPAALARAGRLNRLPAGDGRVMLKPRPGLIAAIPLGVGLDGDESLGWIGISPGSYDFMTPDYQPGDLFAYGVISPAFNSGAGYTSADLGIRFDYSANLRFVGAAEDFHVVYATGHGTDQRGASLPTAIPTNTQFSQSGWEMQSVLTAWDLPRIRQIVGRDLIADVSIQGHYKATVTIYRRPVDAPTFDRTLAEPVSVENLTALRTLVFENPNNTGGDLFPDTAEALRITDGQNATYDVSRSSLAKDAGTIIFSGPSMETTVTLTATANGLGANVATSLDSVSQGTTTITGDDEWRWWGYRQPTTVVHTAAGETRTTAVTMDGSWGCRGGRFPRSVVATGGSEPTFSQTWDADGVINIASYGPWSEETTAEGTSALKTVRKLDDSVSISVWSTAWVEWSEGGRKVKSYSAPNGLVQTMGGLGVDWTEIEYGDASATGFPGFPCIIRRKDGSGSVFTPAVNADESGQIIVESGLLDGDTVASGGRTVTSWNSRSFVKASSADLILGDTLKTTGWTVPEDKFTDWGAPTEWKNDHTVLTSVFVHDGQLSRLTSLTSPLGLQTSYSNFDGLNRARTVSANGITATNTFTVLDVQTDFVGTDIGEGTQNTTTRDALGRLTTSNTTWNGVVDNLGLVHGNDTVDVTRTVGPYGTHTSKIRQTDGSLEESSGSTLPFGGFGGNGLAVSNGLIVSRTELVSRTEVLDGQGQGTGVFETHTTGAFEETHTDAFGRVRKIVTPSISSVGSATTSIHYSDPDSSSDPDSPFQQVITVEASGRVIITESNPFGENGSLIRSGIDLDFVSVETASLDSSDRYTESVTEVSGTKVVTTLSITDEPGPGVITLANGISMRQVIRSEWDPATGITVTAINGSEETITSTPNWTTKTITISSSKGWARTTVLSSLGLPTTNTLSGTGIPTTELTPIWRADGSLASAELEIGGESHTAGFNPDGTLSSLTVPGRGNILGGHTIANGVETRTIDGVTVESQLNGTGNVISGGDTIGRTEAFTAEGGGFKHTFTPVVGSSTETQLSAGFAPISKTYADNSEEVYGYEDELLKSVTLPRGGELEFGYSGDGAQDLTSATWPAVTSGPFSIPALGHGFSYTRAGQLKTIADQSGSRTLGYEHGRLASTLYTAGLLTGYKIIRAHDGLGRHTGTAVERDLVAVHSVESAPNGASDQIDALASGAVKVVPQRDTAGRITGYQWGNESGTFVPAVTQTWQRGAGGRIEYAGSNVPGAPSFDYLLDPGDPGGSFDARGRRLKCETAGGIWTYTYGLSGQLESATHRDTSDQILLGDFPYVFDAIGRHQDKGANNISHLLNQTTAWSYDQAKKLTIRAHPDARVWVGIDNATPSEIAGFTGSQQFTLGTPGVTGQWIEWETLAILEEQGEGAGSPPTNPLASPDAVAEKHGAAWIPPSQEIITYDAAGNREGNAQWDYGWDSKNQLVRARSKNHLGVPQAYDITYAYDAEGRRVSKDVVEYKAGSIVSQKTTTFVWDGWDLVYERQQLPSGLATLERKYLWGPDIANGAAGGAGGLLLIQETKGNSTQKIIPLYDGTGHVVALTNLNKDLLASYAYGPFGEKITANGPMANSNPWRYATKYLDEETGLYYFGMRYFDPVTGQWLSRELLGERESINLYSYCRNDPVNKVDVLGLKETPLRHPTNPFVMVDGEWHLNLVDYHTSFWGESKGWLWDTTRPGRRAGPLDKMGWALRDGEWVKHVGTDWGAVGKATGWDMDSEADLIKISAVAMPSMLAAPAAIAYVGTAGTGLYATGYVKATSASVAISSSPWGMPLVGGGLTTGALLLDGEHPVDAVGAGVATTLTGRVGDSRAINWSRMRPANWGVFNPAHYRFPMGQTNMSLFGAPLPQYVGPRTPPAYSVAMEVQLTPAQMGMNRDQHFAIGNRALRAELASNPSFSNLVPYPQRLSRAPEGWTWQHATASQARDYSTGQGRPGFLHLVPKDQHTGGSFFWRLLHPLPYGGGGYSEWAIPAGAPPNSR